MLSSVIVFMNAQIASGLRAGKFYRDFDDAGGAEFPLLVPTAIPSPAIPVRGATFLPLRKNCVRSFGNVPSRTFTMHALTHPHSG